MTVGNSAEDARTEFAETMPAFGPDTTIIEGAESRAELASRLAEREAILDNPDIRKSVETGLAQSAAGETVDLGSFAKYLDK
jgi:hypothetical protein